MDEGYDMIVPLLNLFDVAPYRRSPFCRSFKTLKDYRDEYHHCIPQGYLGHDLIDEPEEVINEVEVLNEEPNHNLISNQLKLFTNKLESIPKNEEDNDKKKPPVKETKFDDDALGGTLLPLAVPRVED